MKMKRQALALAALMTTAGGAQAAGFALYENNASGLGTAFAGQAAVAQDASTIFFNPAGLTQIPGRQLVGSLTFIHSSADFSGSASPPVSSADGGDAGGPHFVPGAFYAMDINPDLKFGIGIYAPFGLTTEWDRPWAGMTQALKSDMKTINVNPSLAWKVNDMISLGAGINWQYIEAQLTSTPNGSTIIDMEGDDRSWGWNLGALFKLDEATRIGASYRSKVKHQLEGELLPLGYPVTADISMPDMASLSLFRKLTPRLDLLADATWTGWGEFEELRVVHAITGTPLSLVEENWENAWRFTLGFQYHADAKWTWRAGLAYDQTPIPDAAHRTPRIPDEDRVSVAVGAQYRMSKQINLDFGYMHIFFDDGAIAHTEYIPTTTTPLTLTGTFNSAADILGAQFTYNF